MRISYLFIIAIVFAAAIPCIAQDINDPRKESDGLSASLCLGNMFLDSHTDDSDIFSFAVTADFSMSDWAIGIHLPLFFETTNFALPSRSYDEFSDFVQVLKYMRYGYKDKSAVYFRIGTLFGETAKIGHGSVIADYYSDTDFDSPQKGLQFDWDFGLWGFESILNSVTERNLLGTRFYLRPLNKSRLEEFRELSIGISLIADHNAPHTLLKGDEGEYLLDSSGNLCYDGENINFVAFDLEIPVINKSSMRISPYFDYIMMHNYGNGFHLGIHNKFNIPIFGDILPIDLIIEYQNHQSKFMPVYFDSFYEIERYNYPLTISPSTKLAFVSSTKASTGFYSSFKWGIKDLFWIRCSINTYSNDPQKLKNSFYFEAATEAYFELKLLYAQRQIDKFNDILELSEKSIILLNVSLPVKIGKGNLLIGFMYKRCWRINSDTNTYAPIDVYMPYVSYRLNFD